MRKHRLTEEERLAIKLVDIVDRLSTDLDRVGFHFALISSNVHFNRLQEIYETAKQEKEKPPIDYENTLF